MADYIEIDTMALNRDRQAIQSELDKVRSEISRLSEQMAGLGAMWEGPAHKAFMVQFQKDYKYIQTFAEEIRTYIETMEYAQREYQRCEDSVQSAIASIRI